MAGRRNGTVAQAAGPAPLAPDEASVVEDAEMVTVMCTVRRVHLGDGRILNDGDTTNVSAELAAFLIEREQAVEA